MVGITTDKKIATVITHLFKNEHALHKKLEYLIEAKNWNSEKAKQAISNLHEDWYRLRHELRRLHEKEYGEFHYTECSCKKHGHKSCEFDKD